MANDNELTAHEMVELREILCNENLCLKKSEYNASVVKDQDLASFIQNSISNRRQKLQELQQIAGNTSTIH